MRKLVLAAIAFGAAATFVTPASAEAPSAPDRGCGFFTSTDPNPEAPDNQQTGQVNGGPIAQNGTITCTIKVGANKYHTSPIGNGAQAEATGTNGTTVLNPTLVSYTALPEENVYLCSQFNDGGTTWVLDARTSTWITGDAAAECNLAISAGTDDPLIAGIMEQIDLLVCPVIGLADPVDVDGVVTIDDDGDINVLNDEFWLCPPYES